MLEEIQYLGFFDGHLENVVSIVRRITPDLLIYHQLISY